jgi:hypothetical protein
MKARLAGLALSIAAIAMAATAVVECRRSNGQTPTPVAQALPAGFVEQLGDGWRIAVPSTWTQALDGGQSAQRPWQAIDPQPVDGYRANVSVVAEPFTGDSRAYASACEASLRRDRRASVQSSLEDTIDGDLTLVTETVWTPREVSGTAFRTMQAHLASRGTGYVVTCSVSASAFERYRTTCESVVHGFAIER